MHMKVIDIFGDLNPRFYFRISIFKKLILIFRYLGGNLYPFALETSPMLMKIIDIFGDLNPRFYIYTSRISIFMKLILIVQFLGVYN